MRLRLVRLVAAIALLTPAAAPAQDFGLVTGLFSEINDITIFFQFGGVHSSTDLRTPSPVCCLTGAGTEVLLNLRTSETGITYELGLGASYLRGFEAREPSLDLRGSLRALPTISLYGSTPRAFGTDLVSSYLGLNFGLLELWHAQAYDPGGERWSVRAQTFELGTTAGIYLNRGPFSGLFFEGSYRLRRFPTIEWSPASAQALPPEWPRSLDFSGPLFNLGWQFSVGREAPSADPRFAGTWLAERLDGQPLPGALGARPGDAPELRRELTGAVLSLSPHPDSEGGRYELVLLVRETGRLETGAVGMRSPAPQPETGGYTHEGGRLLLRPDDAPAAAHEGLRADGMLHLRLHGTAHLLVLRRTDG
jgi:hypothetical protein